MMFILVFVVCNVNYTNSHYIPQTIILIHITYHKDQNKHHPSLPRGVFYVVCRIDVADHIFDLRFLIASFTTVAIDAV